MIKLQELSPRHLEMRFNDTVVQLQDGRIVFLSSPIAGQLIHVQEFNKTTNQWNEDSAGTLVADIVVAKAMPPVGYYARQDGSVGCIEWLANKQYIWGACTQRCVDTLHGRRLTTGNIAMAYLYDNTPRLDTNAVDYLLSRDLFINQGQVYHHSHIVGTVDDEFNLSVNSPSLEECIHNLWDSAWGKLK